MNDILKFIMVASGSLLVAAGATYELIKRHCQKEINKIDPEEEIGFPDAKMTTGEAMECVTKMADIMREAGWHISDDKEDKK